MSYTTQDKYQSEWKSLFWQLISYGAAEAFTEYDISLFLNNDKM